MLVESIEETATLYVWLIHYTILLATILLMGVTSWKFVQLRHHSIIRCRSLPLTMFTTAVGLVCSMYILGTAPFASKVPCSVLYWLGYTLVPLYAASICAMAIRLAGEYYVGRAAIAVMDRRLRKCSQVTAPLPFASHASDGLSAQPLPSSSFPNQGLMPPSRNSINMATSTDNWLLAHRYLFSVRSMFYGMTIYLIVIIIFGVITQFYADTSTPSSWMTEGRCVYFDWSILLCACLVGFILVILMPCLLFTLCKINDTYGIRRGLVMVLLFSTLGLIVYITLKYAVQVKEYGGFRSVHVIIPVILFNHMVLICWPLYLLRNALPHHYHQAQGNKLPRSRSNNSNVECGRPGIKSSVQYDTSYISRDLFRQLLNDPNRVDSFKRYTVRDLSVENILFYEACQAILTTSSSPRNTLAYQAEHTTLQRRMSMLHSTFLEANSDLEVNLTEETLHRLAECLGMDIAYGDSAAYATLADSVRAAQEEILELMFFDTYPRYLNSTCQNDEPILDEQCLGKYSTDTQEFTLAVQALAQSESQTSTFYLLDRYK